VEKQNAVEAQRQQQAELFDLQAKCADKAENTLTDFEKTGVGNNGFDQINHYKPKTK